MNTESNLNMDAQEIARKLGRAEVAQEVVAWVHRHAHQLGGVPVETLLALCNREAKS